MGRSHAWRSAISFFAACALAGAASPALCSAVEVVWTPSSESPRVIVRYNHEPVTGATINVDRCFFSGNSEGAISGVKARALLRVKADEKGIVALPRLRPGEYRIHVAAEPGYEGDLYLKVSRAEHSNPQPFPIDTCCCAWRSAPWYGEHFATAKGKPVAAKMQQFRLRIIDATGAAVDAAEVGIAQLRAAGPTRVAVLHADKDGRIAATLSAGDYQAVLSAHGFGIMTLHFVISRAGDAGERTITLRIGFATQQDLHDCDEGAVEGD